MPSARRMLACVAAATAASVQGVSVELGEAAVAAGAASASDRLVGKFIGGVPVYNYHRAYQGGTASLSILSGGDAVDTSAHKESWIVALEPGSPSERVREMCLRAQGCSLEGAHPSLPFIAMEGTEDELAAVVEPGRDIARYIDLDVTMMPDQLEDDWVDLQEGADDVGNPYLWGLDRIGAYKRTTMGLGVHVYVTDTGIRTEHVDFGGRAVPFLDVFNDTHTGGTKLCNESTAEVCAGDVHGHGTHCAGTVAGETFGVAPQAKVYAVKVLSDQGPAATSGIIYGMGMVAIHAMRPAIVSMSLGGGLNEVYRDAVDVLVDEGITVVVAAGNDYKDACTKSPAFVPSAITVGATAYGDARSGFSNFGTCVDLWAPGSYILSADGRGFIVPNDASRNLSGTSMACPHVAGAAALLLEANPGMTPAQILASMVSDASVNYITDLSAADENIFLYVGSDGPETPESPKGTDGWPVDEFFASCGLKGQTGPRGDYPVCMCALRADRNANGTMCYDGDKLGCPLGAAMEALDASPSYENTSLSWWYFAWNCSACECLASPPEPAPAPPNPLVAVAMFVVGGGLCFASGFWRSSESAGAGGDVEMK